MCIRDRLHPLAIAVQGIRACDHGRALGAGQRRVLRRATRGDASGIGINALERRRLQGQRLLHHFHRIAESVLVVQHRDVYKRQAEHVAATGGSAYALCRPSGHHAHRDRAGGFCYLNSSAAAAARLLQTWSKVAVLDVDAHHGDGTQNIFYQRADVMTVSLHADPTLSLIHI